MFSVRDQALKEILLKLEQLGPVEVAPLPVFERSFYRGFNKALREARAKINEMRYVDPGPRSGIELIAIERQRQIEQEGWTPAHDDRHTNGSLAQAAAYYAWPNSHIPHDGAETRFSIAFLWPVSWHWQWKKKRQKNRKRQLAVAGALIAAELDRIIRAEAAEDGEYA